MPKYRLRLQQGSRTIVNHIEAKSVQAVLDLFNTLTTMQVSEILKIEYTDDTLPPVDDFLYYPLAKFFVSNEQSGKSTQIVLHNIKMTKNTDEIAAKAKECLEVQTLNIDSCHSFLMKNSKLS